MKARALLVSQAFLKLTVGHLFYAVVAKTAELKRTEGLGYLTTAEELLLLLGQRLLDGGHYRLAGDTGA